MKKAWLLMALLLVASLSARAFSASQDEALTLYQQAMRLYSEEDYPQAREKMLLFLQKFPFTPYEEEIKFRLAQMEEDVERAISLWRQFIADYPEGSFTDEALFHLSEIHFLMGDYFQAHGFYSRLVQRFPESPWRDEASYKMGLCLALMEQYLQAQSQMEAFLASRPNSPLKPLAMEALADCLFEQGQYQRASELYTQLLSLPPSPSMEITHASYQLAFIREKRGDWEQAFEAYQDFLSKYPRSLEAPWARERVEQVAVHLKGH